VAGVNGEMNGTDILVWVDTGGAPTVIGSQRGASFKRTAGTIDYSCKNDFHWLGDYGRLESEISMEALYIPTDAAYLLLRAAYEARTYVNVVRAEYGVFIESALAIVTDLSDEAPDQEAATVSATLKVSGAWASGT
jgi:TP901-1 family phage major tail protein